MTTARAKRGSLDFSPSPQFTTLITAKAVDFIEHMVYQPTLASLLPYITVMAVNGIDIGTIARQIQH
jgi:hypothetical protein